MKEPLHNAQNERALLVQVVVDRRGKEEASAALMELERLVDTAGATVVGTMTQRRSRPTANFFIGEGKLADIQMGCRRAEANLVIFNNELSPVQVNNIDMALGIKVIDRTELILQIFARRAQSSEAQIQVELAQLQYLVSRIPVSKKQQRFQGGIGMRGPGESPFQLRADPMRRRIRDLKKKLDKIQARRRRTRKRQLLPSISLVGYTNAGKSTLLNSFARANSYVDDRLFATLDTKTRHVHLCRNKDILLTDTVGFIRDLPHGLVASFRSTLEAVCEADLLLIVADASDPRVMDQINVVRQTLREIGAGNVESLLLLNKTDRAEGTEALQQLLAEYPEGVPVSALDGRGIVEVREAIAARI